MEEELHHDPLSGNVVGLGFHCALLRAGLCLDSKDELIPCGQALKNCLQEQKQTIG